MWRMQKPVLKKIKPPLAFFGGGTRRLRDSTPRRVQVNFFGGGDTLPIPHENFSAIGHGARKFLSSKTYFSQN